MRNGIPLAAVSELVDEIRREPAQGIVRYGVNLDWQNGTRTQVATLPMQFGAHRVNRSFQWLIDEPRQLGGGNHGASPQEHLLSGVGACILVGFTVGASVQGIQLESLQLAVEAELDLAGFFGLAEPAAVPLKNVRFRLRVSGDGDRTRYQNLLDQAVAHSPNAMSLARGVAISAELVTE